MKSNSLACQIYHHAQADGERDEGCRFAMRRDEGESELRRESKTMKSSSHDLRLSKNGGLPLTTVSSCASLPSRVRFPNLILVVEQSRVE